MMRPTPIRNPLSAIRNPSNLLHSRRGTTLIVAALAVVFLALRMALLAVREPFFDELFTAWISAKSFGGIVDALRHDSGPPLYYFVIHLLGLTSVAGARIVSLVSAAATFAVIVGARPLGETRVTAAMLLAVYPPAVLFATDARAYALCALFLTLGLVALASGRPFAASLAFVAAAYTHYYGALFFPLLLLPPLLHARENRGGSASATPRSSFLATALAVILFAPGIWMALHQPRQSMQWLSEPRSNWLTNTSFAGDYPYALFAPSPWWLITIAALLLVAAIAGPLLPRFAAAGKPSSFALWPAATMAPLFLAIVAGLYFPMRFNAVIAVPLALWIAAALWVWPPRIGRSIAAALVLIGMAASYAGIVDHARRSLDAYRSAAKWTATHVPPGTRVVASGYLYLEVLMNGYPDVLPFPEEQGVHPGWRALPQRTSAVPAVPFVWVGERAAPELSILRKSHTVQPLYASDRALVAAVR